MNGIKLHHNNKIKIVNKVSKTYLKILKMNTKPKIGINIFPKTITYWIIIRKYKCRTIKLIKLLRKLKKDQTKIIMINFSCLLEKERKAKIQTENNLQDLTLKVRIMVI